MGYVGFFGCLLLAFGPSFAVFLLVLSQNAQLVILSIGGSFFWLISALISAIWWFIIPPLRGSYAWIIFSSVIIQEIIRFGFLKLYLKAEVGFTEKARQTSRLTSHPDAFKAALAMGWGAGLAHGLVSYVTLLWEYTGPASYFHEGCRLNLFTFSALQTLCFTILHMLWSIVALESFKEKNRIKMGAVVVSHFLASFITLINSASCAAGITLLVLLTSLLGGITFLVVKRSTILLREPSAVGLRS